MPKPVDDVNQVTVAARDDVLEAIHAVMHVYRARQYRVLREGAGQLTHMEGKVLGFFARHPGATQRGLVEHSGRDKGQLARLIGSLKERGLLAATVDAADRRSVRLEPTAEGRAVQRALDRQSRSLGKTAIAGLSDDEHRLLVELLQKVQRNIEAAE